MDLTIEALVWFSSENCFVSMAISQKLPDIQCFPQENPWYWNGQQSFIL